MPRTEFRCRTCGAVAAEVRTERDGVAVEGIGGTTWITAAGLPHRSILRAIARADAPGLFALNPEFVPCWCPPCAGCYCKAHWRLEVAGADDHPGWYDATYGTCPQGHRRKLDD